MYKKITLTEASKLIKEARENISVKIPEIKKIVEKEMPELPDRLKPILAYSYYKDGVDMRHCYCLHCGNEYDEKDTFSYYSKTTKCTSCNNEDLFFVNRNSHITPNQKYTVVYEVNEEKGFILFATFTPDYKYNMNNMDMDECVAKENYDFLKGKFEKEIPETERYYNFSIFILDKGLRFYDRYLTSGFISPSSTQTRTLLFQLVSSHLVGDTSRAEKFLTDNGIDFSGSLFEKIRDTHNEIQNKNRRAASKRTKKPNAELEMYKDYQPKAIDDEKFLKSSPIAFKLLKTKVGSNLSYIVYCPDCKTFNEISLGEYENKFICPTCGIHHDCKYETSGKGAEVHTTSTIKTLEVMEETKDLLIRVFDIFQGITINKEFEYKITEKSRFFFSPQKINIFNLRGENNDEVVKGRVYDLDSGSYWRSKDMVIQEKEELKEIIENSNMKYIGLIEAWGLNGQPEINNPLDCHRSSYLYHWYKKPCIEQLLKTNLTRATREVIDMEADRLSSYINPSETSVYTILGITKPVFKIARNMNLNLRMIKYCKSFWELDNTMTEDTFRQITAFGSLDPIYEISSKYNISFAKIIEYIESCYNYQCIEKSEALRIWRDYLKMAHDMTYRLDNKNTKFPSSLKKEHDKAIFAYRVVEDELNKKRFAEQAEKNVRYEYSYEKLFVRVPRTPEEIIEEGTNQKHCAASYVNRVREGDTIVAFIRYKKSPNDSYFTIEIKDDVVVQVKGYTNCAPKDKDLLTFLEKFAKAKKLTLNY